MEDPTITVIEVCTSKAEDVDIRVGETLVFTSPAMNAQITFDPNPFGEARKVYTIPQGQELRLTIPETVGDAFHYEVTCEGGGGRRGKRPRVIVKREKVI